MYAYGLSAYTCEFLLVIYSTRLYLALFYRQAVIRPGVSKEGHMRLSENLFAAGYDLL